MEAIEATGIIVDDKFIRLDSPIQNRGKIKLIILIDKDYKPPHSILSFVGIFPQDELNQIKNSIDEDCNNIDNEW